MYSENQVCNMRSIYKLNNVIVWLEPYEKSAATTTRKSTDILVIYSKLLAIDWISVLAYLFIILCSN